MTRVSVKAVLVGSLVDFVATGVLAVVVAIVFPAARAAFASAAEGHPDRRTAGPRPPAVHAPKGAALVFDGVFLLRPQLRDFWDPRGLALVGRPPLARKRATRPSPRAK